MQEGKRNFYLKNLTHPDPQVRREAIQKLGEEQEPFLFKILSTYFSDGHPDVREALYQTFVSVPQRWVAEIVVDVLYSPQVSVRSLAMEILKTLGAISVFPLRRLAVAENREMRRIAAELLGDIPDKHSSEILLNMLDDTDEYVLFAVVESLGKLHEIHAIPKLMELSPRFPRLKPAILNALATTFVYWERTIIQTGMPESDPVQIMSFLLSVQESGISTAFKPILDLLISDSSSFGEEALKALASILKKNPHFVLPQSLLPVLMEQKDRFRSQYLREILLTCISFIPGSESFRFLLTETERDASETTRQVLSDFIKRYPSFVIAEFFRMSEEHRLFSLYVLNSAKITVFDNDLFRIYEESSSQREKEAILELISRSRLPRSVSFLIKQLSKEESSLRARILEHLTEFHDPELWQIFLNYLQDQDHSVREIAMRGLLRFPEKTAEYISSRLNSNIRTQVSPWLDVAFALPIPYAEKILLKWLKRENPERLSLLKEHFKASEKVKEWFVLGQLILRMPELEKKIVPKIKKKPMVYFLDEQTREFWKNLSTEDKKRLREVLRPFWSATLDEQLGNPPIFTGSELGERSETFRVPEGQVMVQ